MDINFMRSKFNMKITRLEEQEVEGRNQLKVVNSEWIPIYKNEFKKSLKEEENKGINHSIEIITAPPTEFQVNTVYLRADGAAAYTYIMN